MLRVSRLSSKTFIAVLLLSVQGTHSFNDDGNSDRPIEWLKKLAENSKRAIDDSRSDDFKKYIPNSSFDFETLSKQTFDVVDHGIPAKVGYGFLAGYSSGFCLKRVSRTLAFIMGGIFMVVQGLAYNGYLKVNHIQIKKDIEELLDINKDGQIDSLDFKAVYSKLSGVLSYNMPTGGGFAAGLLMGLRG
mmetsp:Transcript_3136/g.4850  ORF Transcript_3136/g.4850 Transcript_3136/m.4850 type:complete len:189 (-) Transcript_3136:140-706(-)|eukprot:CAMPEP_0185028380 /NCGR_PEP_ID=MMETSP1103-20130426/14008_1 /TAXON_ID=36769 /ORGANISM="Paraphysomonas bandaiensis, Strain Caron Lab Isolate" /LENGTH=188 /DNA_ID=CAMNT_0027562771 /DNA_START=79 /DNA_END=645 /DNA_ORIENTATION=-